MVRFSIHRERPRGSQPLARLDSLPVEILDLIFGHFAPELPAYSSATPRLHDNDRRHNPNKWEGKFFNHVSMLRDLRLVSSRICAAVTPMLLRSVILCSRKQFVLFLRFLLESPHNGVHVRNLAVFVTLNNEYVGERLVKRISKALSSGTFKKKRGGDAGQTEAIDNFMREFKTMESSRRNQKGEGRWYAAEVAELALFCMLREVPLLHRLALQVPLRADTPRWTIAEDGVRHSRPLWDILNAHLGGKIADSGTMSSDHPRVGSSIKELQLRPDPNEHVYREIEHRQHETRLWGSTDILNYRLSQHRHLLEAFPSLHSLKLASCGEVSLVGSEKDGYAHNRIENLSLHNTSEGPRAIANLLAPERTPHLRSLYVRQRPKQRFGEELLKERELEKEGKDLNLCKAIALRADSLRELHLIFDYTFEYEYFVGPGQRLSCLPSLWRLEKLTIQLQLLFGNPHRLYSEPDLVEYLPPNLVELTIRDDWAIDSIAREQRHRSQLDYPITTQIDVVDGLFPNAADDCEYYCSFDKYAPYRTAVQNMLLRLASTKQYGGVDADGQPKGFPHLRSVTFQVLPSKVYRMDGDKEDRKPALQPLEEDLFKDPRRGFFTDPPRWVPLLGKDMWPKEHWELLEATEPHFGEVKAALKGAGVAFDWRGDARVWLDALAAAAEVDDGRKIEVASLGDVKEEEDDDVDVEGEGEGRIETGGGDGEDDEGHGAGEMAKEKRLTRWVSRLKKIKKRSRAVAAEHGNANNE